jgi:hypothetical protein
LAGKLELDAGDDLKDVVDEDDGGGSDAPCDVLWCNELYGEIDDENEG